MQKLIRCWPLGAAFLIAAVLGSGCARSSGPADSQAEIAALTQRIDNPKSHEQDEQDHLSRGKLYAAAGNTEAARTDFAYAHDLPEAVVALARLLRLNHEAFRAELMLEASRTPGLKQYVPYYIEYARALADNNHDYLANKAIDQAIALAPNDAEVWIAQGDVRQSQRRLGPRAAIESYQQAVACDARNVDARIKLAGALLRNNDAGNAIAQLNAAIAVDSSNADALMLRARAQRAADALAAAVADYRAVLKQQPKNVLALTEAARVELELKDDKAAYRDLVLADGAIGLHGKDLASLARLSAEVGSPAEHNFYAGLEAAERQDFAGADVQFSGAIAKGLKSPRIYLARAIARREANRPGALQDCNAALALDSQFAPALVERATCNIATNHLQAAREDCSAAVEIAPQSVAAHERLAEVDCDLQQYGEALQHTQAAIALDPHVSKAHYLQLLARYRQLGPARYAGASQGVVWNDLTGSIAYDPTEVGSYVIKAQIETDCGSPTEACESARKACEMAPKLGAAHLQLALALRGLNQDTEAQREAELAIQLDPTLKGQEDQPLRSTWSNSDVRTAATIIGALAVFAMMGDQGDGPHAASTPHTIPCPACGGTCVIHDLWSGKSLPCQRCFGAGVITVP